GPHRCRHHPGRGPGALTGPGRSRRVRTLSRWRGGVGGRGSPAARPARPVHAGPFDRSVDHWIQGQLGLSSPGLTALTWLGDPPRVVVITAVIALLCLRARWWRGVALAVLTV